MRDAPTRKSLFATADLDERFVVAVERLADAFAVKHVVEMPGGGVSPDVNFAELMYMALQNLASKSHGRYLSDRERP